MMQWVLAATFICGASVFTSCSSENEDNPVKPDEPVVSVERQAFEAELSQELQKAADNLRFDAYNQGLQTLAYFFGTLNDEALKQQIIEALPALLANTQPITIEDLPAEEQADVKLCLKDRFKLTDEEVNALSSFMLVDAYNTIGTRKITFQNGLATHSESDAFVIESIDAMGRTSYISLKFEDERDGARLFVAQMGGVPVCVQLPEQISVTVSTVNGLEMDGIVTLVPGNESQYLSPKYSDWAGAVNLNASYGGRDETISAIITHGDDHSYNIGLGLAFNGSEKFRLLVKGISEPYTAEYVNSDELKSLRECGPFFAGAYELLKAINCSNIDEIEATLDDNIIVTANVEDVADCLLALGSIQKMHGTDPSFEDVDQYTQALNENIHFNVSLKSNGITAKGSIITIKKGFNTIEYQPAVALQFSGETKPIALVDRLSEKDMANYKQIVENASELGKGISLFMESLVDKFKDFKLF